MNLLYLTIIIPLISFLLLICLGRHIRRENIIVIGISTVLLLCLLVGFACVDYQANTVPETSFIYTRFLWNWFSVDNFNVAFSLYLDGLSLSLLVIFVFFILLIYFFSIFYCESSHELYTFWAYGNLLISSILLLILADNLFVMLIGWEGVSVTSYLLISSHYKHINGGFAAVRTFIVMHVADIFLLIGIFLIYNDLHTLNIRELLVLANDNLAVDSEIIYWVTLTLFIGVVGKIGLFPFYLWFSETTETTMPIMTLLQSSTVIFTGCYFMLRFNSLFSMSSDIFTVVGIVAAISIIFSGCVALVQNDIKKLVTYINLEQCSYIFFAFVTQHWSLSLFYLMTYCVMCTLLLFSTALLIKVRGGERNIHKLGRVYRDFPLIYAFFLLSAISLSALPWVTSSFYTKGDVIWSLMVKDKMGLGTVALVGILLTTLAVFRLIFAFSRNKEKRSPSLRLNKFAYIPLAILSILTTALFIYVPLPIQGIIPDINLETNNQLLFQLLEAAVAILGILIAYVFYVYPNKEIGEIAKAPISKMLIRLWNRDWKFNFLLNMVFIRPYFYLTYIVRKDPLSMWNIVIELVLKKVNYQVVPLENGRLRWYIMSIVVGSIMIVLLLDLI